MIRGWKGEKALLPAVLAALFVAGLVLILSFGPGASFSEGAMGDIEVGKVADKDIVADRELSYVDEKATALRLEAEQRLVLPIFVVDEKAAGAALSRFRDFQNLLISLSSKSYADESLYLRVQSEFPGLLSREDILGLAHFPLRSQAFSHAEAVLRSVLSEGVVAVPSTGLEAYNQDYVELRRWSDGRLEYEEIPTSRLPTLRSSAGLVDDAIAARKLSRPLSGYVSVIVKSFVTEDAFFDADQSARRLDSVSRRVEPVMHTIARGERIVRKGFIIGEADFAKLQATRTALSRADWGRLAGNIGLFLSIFALALLFLGPGISGNKLRRGEYLLAASGAFVYLAAAVALERFAALPDALHLALLLPAALFAMIFAIIVGQRFALLYGLILSLLALLASGLDARPFAFALLSASAAAYTVRKASSRIDLVRAGSYLALFEAFIAAFLAAPEARSVFAILEPACWGAINGFLCGVLTLGFLPVIEQTLNVPTRFRLMELSDLNAPILKRLLTVAPGTYSHSITVAHLAESACREIGANPLLARVGAYYHDIGKIEQPEYFVENQSGYNKHDEINPRLSATVIRSHVKLGMEKARSLGLPEEVVSIIAEHHGNTRIAWFYNQALKEDPEAKAEDFSYPGQPPSSREAAVVMLADTVEAASRTLKRPTLARLDEYIDELVMEKVKQGQLDRSDLTFRDLETIRNTFSRILAGHFHSRIEYPKLKEASR
jgi:putative nucleotidyltransferase with HDIG domain